MISIIVCRPGLTLCQLPASGEGIFQGGWMVLYRSRLVHSRIKQMPGVFHVYGGEKTSYCGYGSLEKGGLTPSTY
jgi:hypothetical protein